MAEPAVAEREGGRDHHPRGSRRGRGRGHRGRARHGGVALGGGALGRRAGHVAGRRRHDRARADGRDAADLFICRGAARPRQGDHRGDGVGVPEVPGGDRARRPVLRRGARRVAGAQGLSRAGVQRGRGVASRPVRGPQDLRGHAGPTLAPGRVAVHYCFARLDVHDRRVGAQGRHDPL